MSLRWKNDLGDFVWVGAVGPYVDVTIGSPIVRGATRANATATVVLRRAGSNNVAGTAVATGDAAEGKFQATFRNANGNKVKVRVGDRITSDVSPDEDWIVPNVMANANAATDEVTGTCPADSFFAEALVMRNGFPDGSHTWPEEDGSFTLDLSSVNVQSTETVRVRCYEYHPGDWVGRAVVAQ
jgi:hypothetical protein